MRVPEREDGRLRELFVRLHEELPPPPFRQLLRAGAQEPLPGGGRALMAASLLALALAGSVLYQAWRRADGATLSPADELALASSLSEWQGPLDFLLETPGRAFLSSTPVLGLPSAPSFDATTKPEEIVQ